jgi:hypothetical protein
MDPIIQYTYIHNNPTQFVVIENEQDLDSYDEGEEYYFQYFGDDQNYFYAKIESKNDQYMKCISSAMTRKNIKKIDPKTIQYSYKYIESFSFVLK